MNYKNVKTALFKLKDSQKTQVLQRFFKTGKGEYGQGDIFLGIIVPKQREVAKKYQDLPLDDIQILLLSKIHEHRLTALLILNIKYQKSNIQEKEKIFRLYLLNTRNINNWDLIDLSAPNIVGQYLFDKDSSCGKTGRSILLKMAKSESLWE